MTKYCLIDVETNGLFDFSKPADADGQPRLAALSMIFTDEEGTKLSQHDFFVKPDGWSMTPETTAINGLTTEWLIENGVPVVDVLTFYSKAIDGGNIIVAHNVQYDAKMMRGELRRAGMDDMFERSPNICVMRALTNICQIPNKSKRGFKFPKLAEALAHFGITSDNPHSASEDANSAFLLFKKLIELDALPTAEVHYAKVPPTRAEGKQPNDEAILADKAPF